VGAYKNISASLYYQKRKKEAVPYLQKALELNQMTREKYAGTMDSRRNKRIVSGINTGVKHHTIRTDAGQKGQRMQ